LLAGPLTKDPKLAEIQAAWKEAASERERRLFALDFEHNIRAVSPSRKRVGGLRLGELAPADFFPTNLTHTKGLLGLR